MKSSQATTCVVAMVKFRRFGDCVSFHHQPADVGDVRSRDRVRNMGSYSIKPGLFAPGGVTAGILFIKVCNKSCITETIIM